jgi:RNA polymerase sigma-70 factor (ECF subfamily)
MKAQQLGQSDVVRLVRASQAGEKAAFDKLVRLYQRQAMRVALGILGEANDAAEAVQEGFVKAYLNIRQLKYPRRFRLWLLKIVTNAAVGQQRAARRRAEISKILRSRRARREAFRPIAPEALKDLKRAVQQAMVQLTEKEAKAITLFGLEDLGQDEVAEIMGCSAEAVRWHVYRARQKLKVWLKEYLQ